MTEYLQKVPREFIFPFFFVYVCMCVCEVNERHCVDNNEQSPFSFRRLPLFTKKTPFLAFTLR